MTSQVASFIANRIAELGKPQIEIAREAGFNKPNIITMIKQGKTRLPLDRIGVMARALECDTVYSPADAQWGRSDRDLPQIYNSCVSRGATVGANAEAVAEAKALIDEILKGSILSSKK